MVLADWLEAYPIDVPTAKQMADEQDRIVGQVLVDSSWSSWDVILECNLHIHLCAQYDELLPASLWDER